MIHTNSTRTSLIHRETGAAWDIVAKAGYSAEITQDVAFIQNGGINLMEPERRLLHDLDEWCHCALHLQCSGGRDLLSLWNMGAKQLIGIDISETLISYAQQKSDALNAPASWYCCDVLETPHALNGSADLVYTGRGALMWMMDIDAWARVVMRLLRPNGRILIYEGHPLDNLWQRDAEAFALRADGVSYFPAAPEENPGFPATALIRETAADQARPKMRERCWRPGEVINALAAVGLDYVYFEEYPDLFWNQFSNIPEGTATRLPHTYAIVMQKKGNA